MGFAEGVPWELGGNGFMFERYTEKARRVIFFARYEASQFGSPYIETEHLLLGLLREDKALSCVGGIYTQADRGSHHDPGKGVHVGRSSPEQ